MSAYMSILVILPRSNVLLARTPYVHVCTLRMPLYNQYGVQTCMHPPAAEPHSPLPPSLPPLAPQERATISNSEVFASAVQQITSPNKIVFFSRGCEAQGRVHVARGHFQSINLLAVFAG